MAECSKCEKWHQLLFQCWDNQTEEVKLICLSCIAVIIQDRLPDPVRKSNLAGLIKELD